MKSVMNFAAAAGVSPLRLTLLPPRFSRVMSYHGVSSAISRWTVAASPLPPGARLKLTGHANPSASSAAASPATGCGASSGNSTSNGPAGASSNRNTAVNTRR